jgi:hypothetical protein
MPDHASLCLAYKRREYVVSIIRKTGMLVFRDDSNVENLAKRCAGFASKSHRLGRSVDIVTVFDNAVPPAPAPRPFLKIVLQTDLRKWWNSPPTIFSGSQVGVPIPCDIQFPGVLIRQEPACIDIDIDKRTDD